MNKCRHLEEKGVFRRGYKIRIHDWHIIVCKDCYDLAKETRLTLQAIFEGKDDA